MKLSNSSSPPHTSSIEPACPPRIARTEQGVKIAVLLSVVISLVVVNGDGKPASWIARAIAVCGVALLMIKPRTGIPLRS